MECIDFSPERWNKVKNNFNRWWAGELDRPLIQITVQGHSPGQTEPELPDFSFVPFYDRSVSAEAIVNRWDYNLSCRKYSGDAFPYVWLNFGAGVLAAFVGADLLCGNGTVWFHPSEDKEIAELHFKYDPTNYWFNRIKDVAQAAMDRWDGSVLVGMTDLGGILDVLSTFRHGEKLLYDLYDHPQEVKRVVWELHELWFKYFEEIDDILRTANPGYSGCAGILSLESSYMMLQCDFCYMISPEMFDEFVKPELSATCRRFTNSFYHLDGPGQLDKLDSLLEIPELKGIQWIPGAGQEDATKWEQVYRKTRDAGKYIQLLVGYGGLDVLDIVTKQVGSAEGILLFGEITSAEEPKLLDLLERYGAL